MKKSTLLKKARARLESNKDRYVCWSIQSAGRANKVPQTEITFLYNWIHNDLLTHRYYNYEHWLENNYPHYAKHKNKNKMFKEGRLQWINWMIQYWKEKGD